MSRIADRLETLRKTSSRIGFGMTGSSPDVRRMLILAGSRKIPAKKTLSTILGSADSLVVIDDGKAGELPVGKAVSVAADLPVGVRLSKGAPRAAVVSGSGCDFMICDTDGPSEVLLAEGASCFVEVIPGVESGKLRAIGALGVEAVLLSTESLDPKTLAVVIECRRVCTATGRPVVLQVEQPISSDQVSILWRAGVGALFIDVSGGTDLLMSMRAAVDAASCESRQSVRDTSVSIGAHLANLNGSSLEEEEDGEEEDGEDDDEE